MTQVNSLALIYQICGKICHDLAAPLSAISMGLEMMEEQDDSTQNNIALVKESTQSAVHKLEALRCLFGFAHTSDRPHLKDVQESIAKITDKNKHQILWNSPAQLPIKGEPARLIQCCILLALSGCPRGGTLTINPDFSITATGPKVSLPPETVAHLHSPHTPETSPRDVLTLFTWILAQKLETSIKYTQQDPNIFYLKMS